MAENMKHKINKYIKIILIIACFVACEKICLPTHETKSSNSNLNKTLDLHVILDCILKVKLTQTAS